MENEPEPLPKDDSILEGELSSLRITALQIHEMFLELKAVGFKHSDAIQIIGIMLTSGILFNPSTTFGFSVDELDFNDEGEDTFGYENGEDGEPIL